MVSERRLTESLRSKPTAVSRDMSSPDVFFARAQFVRTVIFAENFYPLTSQANNKMPN